MLSLEWDLTLIIDDVYDAFDYCETLMFSKPQTSTVE